MDNEESVMDPQENPVDTGHLPAAGEVGSGQVSYHDPVTQPTDDNGETNDQAEPMPEQADKSTPGAGGTAGLS